MDEKGNEHESNGSATGIYHLPGESAVVINGVPEIVSSSSIVRPCNAASRVVETDEHLSLGEWFVGRDVQKLFNGSHYSGKVTEYNKESRLYKVQYEDGNLEDLEWKELNEILRPLDVTISLKTLAQRMIRKSKKPIQKSRKNDAGSQNPKIKKAKKN